MQVFQLSLSEGSVSLSEGSNFAQRERSEGAAIKYKLSVAPGFCSLVAR